MVAHWRYFKYVCRHKWFVFIAGCRLGIPFLAAMHDNSKFLPSEWFPYVAFFYGKGAKEHQRRDATGYYKPFDTGNEAFDLAWLHHQHLNKHHWQHWILPRDDGNIRVFPMPNRYRREMLADWIGAGRAQGKPNTRQWYFVNRQKMQLHPETRAWIEDRMGITATTANVLVGV